MTWGHKHKPQGQQQGQASTQGQAAGPMSASSPEEAEAIKRAHWQAGCLLRDAAQDLAQAMGILQKDKRIATAVLGADLAGVTAGGAIGGAAGFGYADLGSNGITLVADLAEQNMAQQADRAVKMAANRITQAKQVAPDLPAIDLALVQDLTSAMYWDIISGALSEYKIRHKLQKSIKSVGHMQEQVQKAMDWLCQMYNISMDDAMRYQREVPLLPAMGGGSASVFSAQPVQPMMAPQYAGAPPYGASGYGGMQAQPFTGQAYPGSYTAQPQQSYPGSFTAQPQQSYPGSFTAQPQYSAASYPGAMPGTAPGAMPALYGYGAQQGMLTPGAGYGPGLRPGQISQDDNCSVM